MKILKLRFRNFENYGSVWQELEFTEDSSFSLVTGNNGNGKSSLSRALVFSLYGRIPGRNLSDLPNRLNGTGLETEVELISNNKRVLVRRGISPSYLKVEVNGKSDIEDTAGKSNIEDYLQDEIYNIPLTVFNNIISLSVNDFKSFISMKKTDKKIILDKIFGLSIINQMYELLKADIKSVKDEESKLSNSISLLKDQSSKTHDQLKLLSEKLLTNNTAKKNEIQSYIEKLKTSKLRLIEELEVVNSDEETLENLLDEKISLSHKYSFSIKKTKTDIDIYSNDTCPTCKGSLTTDEHKHHKNDLLKGLNELELKYTKVNKTIEKIKSQFKIIKESKQELDKNLHKIDIKSSQLLKEFKEINDFNSDEQTKSLSSLILDIETEIKSKERTTTLKQKELITYSKIDSILNEKGIKQHIIKTIIPNLNSQIQTLLNEVNLDYRLVFNEDFDATIYHLGKDISIQTLSSGESKKLDFVVILSLIKLLKIKFPGLNILFLDEIFSTLDMDAQHHIVKILSEYSKKLNLHIFVVNHSPLEYVYFTNKISIERNNSFSHLISEKTT